MNTLNLDMGQSVHVPTLIIYYLATWTIHYKCRKEGLIYSIPY